MTDTERPDPRGFDPTEPSNVAAGDPHLTMAELLELRDGGATTSQVRSHHAACAACRAELERLHQVQASLRAMPVFDPEDDWDSLRTHILAERRRRLRRRVATALAATLVVLLVAGGVREWTERRAEATVERLVAAQTRELQERSWLLDAALQDLEVRRIPLEGWRARAIVDVRGALRRLDEEIDEEVVQGDPRSSPTPADLALWLERVELQSELVELWTLPVARQQL